ncbi:hypothetical protein DVS28_a2903 [Euzebya pacifica]|uniref:Uncharacterized protein n=1 Tax=Euzebya pacifica TaxID=1608957 RepID=A0A346XZD5_9ACTN|nr:hypothetical protein [Euzebya pacifica]AXV07582.1 hypothetical protein DVS28_a2903 [Euzebya pacifica]
MEADIRHRLEQAAGTPAELDLRTVLAARDRRHRTRWATVASLVVVVAVTGVATGLRTAAPDPAAVADLPAGVEVVHDGPTPDLTLSPIVGDGDQEAAAAVWRQFGMDGQPPAVPDGHVIGFVPLSADCSAADIVGVEAVHTRPVTWTLDVAVTPGCEPVEDPRPAPAVPMSGTRTLVVLAMPWPDDRPVPGPMVRSADQPRPTPWARAAQD